METFAEQCAELETLENNTWIVDDGYYGLTGSIEPWRTEALLNSEGDLQLTVHINLGEGEDFRFGFAIAYPDLISGMRKVKDSYNCNTLSIAAATAAILDQDWMLENTQKIRETRTRLTTELRSLGFDAVESQANFVWTTHAERSHQDIYETLKSRKILVRFMKFPALDGKEITGLRITVGTDEEVDALLAALG